MQKNRRNLLKAAIGSATALSLGSTGLLSFPSMASAEVDIAQARIINGFPPGSTVDVVARKIAELLNGKYAKNVIVENRTGAGGQLAVTGMRSNVQDGSTILLTPMSILGVYPHTYEKLPYDPINDLSPVSKAVTYEYGIAVGPAVPEEVTDINGLIDWFRKNPDRSNCGSPAIGSTLHFVVELLARSTDTPITHVGYRGSSPGISDMLGGVLSAFCSPIGSFLGQPELRVLATSGSQRNRFMPEVKTLAEQGFSDMVYQEWYGLFVPAKTPAEKVETLSQLIQTALKDPSVLAVTDLNGQEITSSTPEELKTALAEDTKRWGEIVKSIGFTLQS